MIQFSKNSIPKNSILNYFEILKGEISNLQRTEHIVNFLSGSLRASEQNVLQLPQENDFFLGGIIRGVIVIFLDLDVLDRAIRRYEGTSVTAQAFIFQTSQIPKSCPL